MGITQINMTKDIVIVLLSIQIALMSFFWTKAEKTVSYLQGQQAVHDWASQVEDEACGPYEQPVTKRGHK